MRIVTRAINYLLSHSETAPSSPTVTFFKSAERALHEDVDVFRCFFSHLGDIHSVHRVFPLLPMDGYKKGLLQNSENILTRYTLREGRLHPDHETSLGHGTDPRVVSDGTVAYIFKLMRRDGDTERAFYRVRKLPGETVFDVHGAPGLPLGKNWQPFLKDGRLFAIYGFAPLTVLEVHETGEVEIVHQSQTQLDIAPPHEAFTLFRGGTNGILEDDGCLYGFGHSTVRNFRHDTFMWRMTPDYFLDVRICNATVSLNDAGYGITDPTSLFTHEGASYLGLAMSERDWYYEQKFADLLLRLPGVSLATLFTRLEPPLPNVELPASDPHVRSIVPATCVTPVGIKGSKGSVCNHGRTGCLLQTLSVPTFHNGQPIEQLKLYFTCDNVGDGADFTVTVSDVGGTALLTHPVHERGKNAYSLKMSHLADGQKTSLKIRVDCREVELLLDNIRVFYSCAQAPNLS